MTHDESNRRIAEALGWTLRLHSWTRTVFDTEEDPACLYPFEESCQAEFWHTPECTCPEKVIHGACIGAQCPDFYASEDASAMLLEAMRHGRVWKTYDGNWCASHDEYQPSTSNTADRKTAIAEAFKQWKGISEASK